LSNPDIDVVGETGNVKDVAHLAGTLHPTLVLMEIFFSGIHGIAGIREMKSLYPRIKILVLTAHLSDTTVQAAMQAGASGLLEKSASLEEVWSAIDNVIAGKTYLCPRAAEIVARGYAGNSRGPLDMLTPREHEALRCIAGGMRNKDIALHLGISVNTVEKHRANLMDKLNLRKVASLTALAIQQGVSTISATPNKRATGVVEAARATDWDRAMPPPHTKKRAAS
jgi:DNA-binding NarL/FixJ family response regulator